MKNRLYDYICIFVVLEILQSSIGYATIISDTRSTNHSSKIATYQQYCSNIGNVAAMLTKREISVPETSQLKEDTNYAKEINLQHEENNELEEDGTYQDDTTSKKRKISKKAANFMSSADLHSSNAEESFNHDNVPSYLNSQLSNEDLEETEEEDEEATKQKRDKNEKANNLIRLSRNINDDFDRYTDQERSSLYDDYEAKDIAKRGILSGSEGYEEIEDDLPGIEDMAAVQELTNEEKRETRKDTRVKRDQAEILEILDKSRSNVDNPAKLEESKIAEKNPYLRGVSSAPNTIKNSESKDVISKLSDSSEIQEPANTVALLKKDESNAECEKRVEKEIQRKIDLIKEEIKRDIEAQQRIRNIENNNARFDELQDQEHEDEERQNFENKSIKKRQTIAKRSVQETADDAITSSEKSEKKRSLKKEQIKKRHQSNKISTSDTSKQNENVKRQIMITKPSEQIPSKELFKKKHKPIRQIFLVNNDQIKRRQLRSYSLPSAQAVVRSEDELFMNPKLNSYLHMDNRMLEKSSPASSEDENNEEEQSLTAELSDSLVPLIGSSQELNPRLEKEYKEAFGGLQSEPGNALVRFKRVKRVLTNDANTI